MKTHIFALLATSLLAGCGFAFLPHATTRPVAKEQIIGTWHYFGDDRKTKVTIDFRSDGSFTQTVQHHRGGTQQQVGNWFLDGPYPRLTVLKPVVGAPESDWILEDACWWIVDSHQQGVNFAVFGAADDRDADSCYEFEKER